MKEKWKVEAVGSGCFFRDESWLVGPLVWLQEMLKTL